MSCQCGAENLCPDLEGAKDIGNGKGVAGGFANYLIVPSHRYLFDLGGIDPAVAATAMCGGLTAYSAIKKIGIPPRGARDILVLGLGGVGFQGFEAATALFGEPPMVADIAEQKLEAARARGATAFNVRDAKTARKAILKASAGGVHAVVDFVGSSTTVALAARL